MSEKTLSDKIEVRRFGRRFISEENLKQFIKDLKGKFEKIYNTKAFIIQEIDKLAGATLAGKSGDKLI